MTTSKRARRARALTRATPELPPLSVIDGVDVRVREEIRGYWKSFVGYGIALLALGFLALGTIGFATLSSSLLLSGFLVAAGIIQGGHACCVRSWRGFTRRLLAGVLSLVVGLVIAGTPLASELVLARAMAAFFIVGGIMRIGAAGLFRFPGRRFAVIADVSTVLLGVAILVDWPMSRAWALGTFVGVDLVFDGWSLVMAGVAAYELGRRRTGHLRLVH